ncbi:MAG: hypothetical protein IH587_02490 [Anaerolineae bacterium]|nr:hypothetical protein [Anaerolineae bacterium]
MTTDLLDQIQKLQFDDRAAAEAMLLDFVRGQFALDVERVELRPLAVSLNSFNGFLYLRGGERLFFKTHTEPDNIVGEYYNAEQLAEAGYPILRPRMQSTEVGKQLLIYDYIDAPSVFDVAWAIEQGDARESASLSAAQGALDDALWAIYERTLAPQSAEDAERAPVHQLFYHRLTGGRLARFYGPDAPPLRIDDRAVAFADVRRLKWTINGQRYDLSLDDIIARAIALLHPAQPGPSIAGHGDAHNGNLFYHKDAPGEVHLTYFDPAFAGRHHPLLDLTKPLFHNVFAMWMYHPADKAARAQIAARIDGDRITVTHDYALHPIRLMFWRSKVERVLIPTLKLLTAKEQLRADWRAYLKAALFCCPLLTKNLLDADTYPPEIALLGLAQTVEMGAESAGVRSLVDTTLDEVERTLN